MRSYWKNSKAIICKHMKKNIGDLVVMKKYLTKNQALVKRDRKLICKKE